MKKHINKLLFFTSVALMATSCENGNVEFSDFDYQGVFFGYQYPVRTIVLGEDIFDNSLDNKHQFEIYATMGGAYDNNKKVSIDIEVDNSLCENLYFEDATSPVTPLPSSYYEMHNDQIILNKKLFGSVGISLSDEFFNDPLAIDKHYVLPLRMVNVHNADTILSGIPKFDGAPSCNSAAWDISPKDYVLYALRFINPYEGNFLRRGKDQVTLLGEQSELVRHRPYVEDDQVIFMETASLKDNTYNVAFFVDDSEVKTPCSIKLTFSDDNSCIVSTDTEGFSCSGTGKFVSKGEKLSWGNKDRSAIYLDYTLSYGNDFQVKTQDTLVVRDRGVSVEEFIPVYQVK